MSFDNDCGKAGNARVGAFGVAGRPLRLAAVEKVRNGHPVNDAAIAGAKAAAAAAVDPPDDIHATGAYRKTLLGVMLERALRGAQS